MSTYTTRQGDMWDGIAYTQLGDVKWTDLLMSENLGYLDYFTFPAGIVLQLPEVPDPISNTLPPWKKVAT